MSSESEMLRWKGEGLPGDDLSMQNGVVILNAMCSPLLIDPSSQVGAPGGGGAPFLPLLA